MEDYVGDSDPKFNYALDTLERLSMLKKMMSFLHMRHQINSPSLQEEYMKLVREYFIAAVPILPENVIESYKDKVTKMKMETKSFAKNGITKSIIIYSDEIQEKLDEIMIELQYVLRRYYMPRGDDDDDLI